MMSDDLAENISVLQKRFRSPSPQLKSIVMSVETVKNLNAIKRLRTEKSLFDVEEEQTTTPPLVNSTAEDFMQFDLDIEKFPIIKGIKEIIESKTLEKRADEIKRICEKINPIVHADNRTAPVTLGGGITSEVNGNVFAFRVGDDELLACKNVADMHGTVEDNESLRETIQEGRLMAFLSEVFVIPSTGTINDVPRTQPSNPHFVALLRHDMTHTPLKAGKFIVADQKWTRCVSAMYLELCQRTTVDEFIRVNHGSKDDIEARRLAASLAGQIIMAILALGSASISHNDMRLTNILLFSKETPKTGLFYFIPKTCANGADTYLRLPGGLGIPLVMVADFGVASVNKYENDPHFDHVEHLGAKGLAQIYYTSVEIDELKFSRLSLTSHGDEYGHFKPMSHIDLGDFERDFATVFTFFERVVPDSEAPWLRYLKDIGTAAINELSAVRPKNYTEQRLFAVNLFKNCDLLKDFVVSPSPVQTAWRLPTDDQAPKLRRNLISALDKSVQKGVQFNLIK